MAGFDMGGPFNKVAFLFSVGMIASGQTQFMGAMACAIQWHH
ncbi:PTS system fructose-specific IIA /IIB / IIC component [Vibrio variabilis]|uniref:PTS system fructose-specific IIA /IIB / IIC component n=1 Tax=Vibrio variabilis TaxID=990271 RepID=A0ABQ0JLF7_9VIBR|nr:PTS system fructose-specific IIA /IIB / IIC component [Vibrio variabilis]